MSNQLLAADNTRTMTAATGPIAEMVGTSPITRDRYKRPFDLTFIILAHLLLLPLWVVLWIVIPLAIWLGDRGPVFYSQERYGRYGRRFKVIKFRTMVKHAEAQTGPVWASEDDARVTMVGRLLRRTRLDEMPQIINIVRGDMSLVGPRPERPVLAEQFAHQSPAFSQRLRVRPGIAGLAQVRGNYSTRPRNKLRYDNLYIKVMSPWVDLKLIFLSVWVVLRPSRPANSPARARRLFE